MFSIGKGVAENGITTMLHYYSKTFQGMAWLHAHTFYPLGVVSSYPFRHIAGLLIRQYFPYQWNQVIIFYLPIDSD